MPRSKTNLVKQYGEQYYRRQIDSKTYILDIRTFYL